MTLQEVENSGDLAGIGELVTYLEYGEWRWRAGT
jgi:hypothetical protein